MYYDWLKQLWISANFWYVWLCSFFLYPLLFACLVLFIVCHVSICSPCSLRVVSGCDRRFECQRDLLFCMLWLRAGQLFMWASFHKTLYVDSPNNSIGSLIPISAPCWIWLMNKQDKSVNLVDLYCPKYDMPSLLRCLNVSYVLYAPLFIRQATLILNCLPWYRTCDIIPYTNIERSMSTCSKARLSKHRQARPKTFPSRCDKLLYLQVGMMSAGTTPPCRHLT